MALIDEISKDKKDTSKTDDKCQFCKSVMNKLNTKLFICEICFNKQVSEALAKIEQNIHDINQEIIKAELTLKRFDEGFKTTNDPVLKNKLEIDILNINAILRKLHIDSETNMIAYYVNQRQANQFRKVSGWELFEINDKYNMEQNYEKRK